VKGTRIVDVGTASELCVVSFCLTEAHFLLNAEDLTKPVKYLSTLLPDSITSKLRIGSPPKVVQLDPNAVLVPGLAGTIHVAPLITHFNVLIGVQMHMHTSWKMDT
jgi:hypothetical protein